MPHTNINLDAIEQALPLAALKLRASLIDEAVKRINVWLVPDPTKVEVVNIVVYKYHDYEQKVSLDPIEQRKLIEQMFDNNMSCVFIQKTSEAVSKKKGIFSSKTESSIVTTETRNYLFSTVAIDIKKSADVIKDFILTLRNPRVSLTVEEHKIFVSYLKVFDINLPDYYI